MSEHLKITGRDTMGDGTLQVRAVEEYPDGSATFYTVRDNGVAFAQEWWDGHQGATYDVPFDEVAYLLEDA